MTSSPPITAHLRHPRPPHPPGLARSLGVGLGLLQPPLPGGRGGGCGHHLSVARRHGRVLHAAVLLGHAGEVVRLVEDGAGPGVDDAPRPRLVVLVLPRVAVQVHHRLACTHTRIVDVDTV